MKPFEGKRYGKRDRMNTGHNPTETGKRKTEKRYAAKVIETAAMMKTAAKAAKDKSAPRQNVASAHKMNMRMNIHTYTQKQCTHENILPTYTI